MISRESGINSIGKLIFLFFFSLYFFLPSCFRFASSLKVRIVFLFFLFLITVSSLFVFVCFLDGRMSKIIFNKSKVKCKTPPPPPTTATEAAASKQTKKQSKQSKPDLTRANSPGENSHSPSFQVRCSPHSTAWFLLLLLRPFSFVCLPSLKSIFCLNWFEMEIPCALTRSKMKRNDLSVSQTCARKELMIVIWILVVDRRR